jgi:osmotically-inducible protein OsmY
MERASVNSNYPVSGQIISNQDGEKDGPKTVKSEHHCDHYDLPSDMEILAAIRSALRSDGLIDENDILINVQGGWVYLEGKVPTEDQRNLAMKLATDIFGVTRVTNYLTFPRAVFHIN